MATRIQYRHALAPLLGVHETGTASATASATANTTAQMQCLTALASGARFKSSVLPDSLFRGKWLYRPASAVSNDRDRLIATYTAADGLLTPDDAWTNAPTSEAFEITSLFSGADLNTLINEALKRVWAVGEFTLTPLASSNIRRHDLTATLPGLTNPRWVYQLGHLESGESRVGTTTLGHTNPFDRAQGGRAELRGGHVWIEGPSWTTTQTPYVLVVVPAYVLCKPTAGVFGSQSGLALENDEAPVDERLVAWRAILEAADRLDHFERTGQATQEAMQSRAMAATRFQALQRANLVIPERTFSVPRVNISPSFGGAWGRA